jgi:hypothetical protein
MAKKAMAKKAAKKPLTANGDYAWLLNRAKAGLVDDVAEENKKAARAAIRTASSFDEAVKILNDNGWFDNSAANLVVWFNSFIAKGVIHKDKKKAGKTK